MFKEFLTRIKNGESSNQELALSAICLILLGIVIGIIIAPARVGVYGSFNGNQGSLTPPENAVDFLRKKENKEN